MDISRDGVRTLLADRRILQRVSLLRCGHNVGEDQNWYANISSLARSINVGYH